VATLDVAVPRFELLIGVRVIRAFADDVAEEDDAVAAARLDVDLVDLPDLTLDTMLLSLAFESALVRLVLLIIGVSFALPRIGRLGV